MQEQIEAILRPFRRQGYDTGAEMVGDLWQVWIGSHAGARANGVSLAKDLAEKVRGAMPPPVEPPPVPPQPLITPQADELAKLRARIAELEAERLKPADNITVPDFLKPPEADMNFHDDFIAREAQDGEDRTATIARLQLEFEVLTNRSYGGPLSDTDQARLSELTTNLRLGG